MITPDRLLLVSVLMLVAACGGPKPPASATTPAAASDVAASADAQAREKQALEAGVEAVVYGLPLVIMDITRAKSTNVPRPDNFAAPVNIGGLTTADPLDPRVIAWWKAKTDGIYKLIPDFGGYLVE